jgi:hypothetical protein
MIGKWRRIRKEAVAVCFKALYWTFCGRSLVNHEELDGIVGPPAEIRTWHLPKPKKCLSVRHHNTALSEFGASLVGDEPYSRSGHDG